MYSLKVIAVLSLVGLTACSKIVPVEGPKLELNKYVVRAGDTVESISYRYRIDPNDLRALNRLSNGNALRPGLRLSLVEIATQTPQVKKIDQVQDSNVSAVTVASRSVARTRAVVVPASAMREPNEEILETVEISQQRLKYPAAKHNNLSSNGWVWPVNGPIARGYKPREINRQGLDIRGRAGEEIFAAADGTVVYSGQDLASHGKLVILRHTDNVLSAYSSTNELFVQEEEFVRAGDSIASLGTGSSSGSILHFEIRKNGKPVDPLQYLPQR